MIEERRYIKDAIYDWVAAVVKETGRTDPVVWDHEDGPRPVAPFVSLEFTGTATPGHPYYGPVEQSAEGAQDNWERKISRFVQRALTMYAFGESAMDLLETIKASIDKDVYVDMLAKKGLAINQTLEVMENPANRGGIATENSALFEFYITYIRTVIESLGYIETVHILPDDLPIGEITNQGQTANEEDANG